MESKMQMVKALEKNGARKRDPYLCQKKVVMVSWNNYKRKVSRYDAYFINHYTDLLQGYNLKVVRRKW